ncbi:hypothetical protein [Burkholderia sp. LAS2]|uniref:hypothetical protein n=1 Tax=Burkholderia sp. LAS2 TaxID=2813843 RepID=UPI001BCF165A|nr:hypothetical protein [Burkholderia sp. LAS2]QVN10313.1 hypothetical protein JYG37_13305 [Burkholderia sp. LAS2]
MSFATSALLPLYAQHDFPLERRRAKHADIGQCAVEVGSLARLPQRTGHECIASIPSFHAEAGPRRT